MTTEPRTLRERVSDRERELASELEIFAKAMSARITNPLNPVTEDYKAAWEPHVDRAMKLVEWAAERTSQPPTRPELGKGFYTPDQFRTSRTSEVPEDCDAKCKEGHRCVHRKGHNAMHKCTLGAIWYSESAVSQPQDARGALFCEKCELIIAELKGGCYRCGAALKDFGCFPWGYTPL